MILSEVTKAGELVTPRISCVGYKFEFACKEKAGPGIHSPMYLWGCGSETTAGVPGKSKMKSQRKLSVVKKSGFRC